MTTEVNNTPTAPTTRQPTESEKAAQKRHIHIPPFSMDGLSATPTTAKRTAKNCTTGAVLDKGKAPAAELHITYRKQFRFQYVFAIRDDTPYWNAAAGDGSGSGEPAGMLAKGDHVVQIDVDKSAKKQIKISRRSITFRLGRSEQLGKTVWFPTNRHPEKKKGWKSPKLLWPTRQWGIKGDLVFRKDPFGACSDEKAYKMVTVWERWTKDDLKVKGRVVKKGPRWTEGMMTVGPGIYAGYVKTMGKKAKSAESRKNYPSIWVIWEWDKTKKQWVLEVPRVKTPGSRVDGVFVHPGPWPSYFLGCMAPGFANKEAVWGFETFNDTRDALWEIFKAAGVNEDDYVKRKKYVHVTKKETIWFVIRIDDPAKVTAGNV